MCKEEEGLASVPCDVGQEGGREGSGWQRPVPSACHQGLDAAGRRMERVDCWMVVGEHSGSCRAFHRLGILSGGGSRVALAAADASVVAGALRAANPVSFHRTFLSSLEGCCCQPCYGLEAQAGGL